jgi:PiT family inorganic phosphate transporter
MGAIAWNLITWYLGIPSSSSHALIGGFMGAGLAGGGMAVVKWNSLLMPLLGIVLAPTMCLAIGYLMMLSLLWICRNRHPAPLNRLFKQLQFLAAAIYSIAHGGNDAQKTVGIICALLVGEGFLKAEAMKAGWTDNGLLMTVVIAAYLAISLGTLSGGWRIVKTMGTKITKLRPVDGFAAATAGGVLIIGFTEFGLPVSTTHSIAGSIMGVGATKRLSAVRWGISARIVWAWIFTIPASAATAILTYWLCRLAISGYDHLALGGPAA